MATSIYPINKGVNKSVEFKGLKAQYIWYLGGGLVGLLLLFAVLYLIGINTFVCLTVIAGAGGYLFYKVYQMSNKYGRYGMMKKAASRMLPRVIRTGTRQLFYFKKTVYHEKTASHP